MERSMLQRGNNLADRLISRLELSNTLPEFKRRLFIVLMLVAILGILVDFSFASLLDYDALELATNVSYVFVLTAAIWLLWRRRERQELILLSVFFVSSFYLLLTMFHRLMRVPTADIADNLLGTVAPWFIWFMLLYMVSFFTFRAVTALRSSLIISALSLLVVVYTIFGRGSVYAIAIHDFLLLFLTNLMVILMAYPLAQAQEKNGLTDFLTGLPNRNRGYTALTSELERTQRYGEMFAVMLFDIDYFKKINDSKGHPAGDVVLREVAAFVEEHVRRTDLVCRWGGEEFLILMPHTDLASASLKANHLRQQIMNRPFNKTIPLTVSFGVTTYYPYDSTSSMLERADRALYRAKRNGRNLVESE
jgi:diguanylate cyclase (GGDEF)-like protein